MLSSMPESKSFSRQNSETYLKAPDYEGERFWAVLLDDLTSLHGEVVLLLARLRLHRLHRSEPREVAVREEDEVSLPPCLHILSPLVQVALLYHLSPHFSLSIFRRPQVIVPLLYSVSPC